MARRFKSSDYLGMLGEIAPEIHLKGASEVLDSVRLPELKHVVAARRRAGAAALPFVPAAARARRPGAARAARRAHRPRSTPTTRSTSSSRAERPDRRRARRSRTSTSSTTRATAPRRWRSGPTTSSASRCRSTTASAWCSACCALPPRVRRWCSRAKASTPATRLRSIAEEPLHRAARRADDVRRDARASRVRRASTFRRLRTGIMAGAPCPIETMRKVIAQMHMRQVTIAYGMTETSPISFQSSLDDPLERRVSTVGRDPAAPRGEDRRRRGPHRAGRHGRASCARAAMPSCAATGRTRRARARRSTPPAGCTPATWRRSTPRATRTSSAASRTC